MKLSDFLKWTVLAYIIGVVVLACCIVGLVVATVIAAIFRGMGIH